MDLVHDRLWNLALSYYAEDFRRLEEALVVHKRPFAAESGKENLRLRGLITAVLTTPELRVYSKIHRELCDEEFGSFDIFDHRFRTAFSRNLRKDSDRARIFAQTQDGYKLLHDSTLRNDASIGDARMQQLFPEALRNFPRTAQELGVPEYLQLDEQYVYGRLLADVFRGSESKRMETSVNIALGLAKKVIVIRQSVVPDVSDEYVINSYADSSDVEHTLMSRIGMGEVLELGPLGLSRRVWLRSEPCADVPVGHVWADTSCSQKLPVYAMEHKYRFDSDDRRVVLTNSCALSPEQFHL